MKNLNAGLFVAVFCAAFAASAADVTLIKSDAEKEGDVAMFSYWKDGTHWSNGEIPSAANDYFVTNGNHSLYVDSSSKSGTTNVFNGASLTFGIPGQTSSDTKVVPKFIVWGNGGSD